jgi:hypothetical protein
MATTYQTIIDKAELILQDEDTVQANRRWNETELLTWAKDAEKEIAKLKPDANPVIEVVALSAGCEQSIPSDAHQLLDVICNMSTDGTTIGTVIPVVEKKYMNAINPNWMADTYKTVVSQVIYDSKRSPRKYWVYPQSYGNNYIKIMTSKTPANSAKVIGDNILLPDEYDTAILHFTLAMAFMKDSDVPQSADRFKAHMDFFLQLLGKKELIEETINPKRHRGSN